LLAALIAFAPQIIPIGFGGQWHQSVAIMQILALSGAINTMAMFDRSLLFAAGAPGAAFRLQGGQTVLSLVVVGAVVPFGIVGVAVARVMCQVVFWPIRLVVLRRRVGLDVKGYVTKVARPIVVCVVLFGAVGALQWTSWPDVRPVVVFLAPSGAVALALYLVGMRLVAPDDVADLRRLFAGARLRRRRAASGGATG
jgi:PST family polysaccharide transporter